MRKLILVIFDFVLTIILMLVLVSLISGCGSKKKTTESVVDLESKTELNTSEGAASLATNSNVLATIKKKDASSETETETNYKPIDPTKPSSVVTPEGKKYILDNAEVTERKKEKYTNSTSEETKASNISSLLNYWGKDTSLIQFEKIHSTANSSLDKSNFNYWSWLWVLIIIILGIGLNYLNNRFKWVSYVTAIFKKK